MDFESSVFTSFTIQTVYLFADNSIWTNALWAWATRATGLLHTAEFFVMKTCKNYFYYKLSLTEVVIFLYNLRLLYFQTVFSYTNNCFISCLPLTFFSSKNVFLLHYTNEKQIICTQIWTERKWILNPLRVFAPYRQFIYFFIFLIMFVYLSLYNSCLYW